MIFIYVDKIINVFLPLKKLIFYLFYGAYLSFVGALSLGFFLYKREEKISCGEGIREAAFLEEGMEESSKKVYEYRVLC